MAGLEAIFRWLHVFAGITWIGHLYFFNWVNGPLAASIRELLLSWSARRASSAAGH